MITDKLMLELIVNDIILTTFLDTLFDDLYFFVSHFELLLLISVLGNPIYYSLYAFAHFFVENAHTLYMH